MNLSWYDCMKLDQMQSVKVNAPKSHHTHDMSRFTPEYCIFQLLFYSKAGNLNTNAKVFLNCIQLFLFALGQPFKTKRAALNTDISNNEQKYLIKLL